MKKSTAALLLAAILPFSLFGCADGSSATNTPSNSAADESSAEKTPVKVSEPDFMGYLVSGSTNYIGMSMEEIEKSSGGEITKENGFQQDSIETGYLYYKYSLGEMDSMLAGRLKLDRAYDISCYLKCKDDVITCVQEEINGITKAEAAKICEDYIAALDGRLPDGYTQFKPSNRGKKYEVGFSKGVDDYVISMAYDENLGGDYDVTFALQTYAERYGMK